MKRVMMAVGVVAALAAAASAAQVNMFFTSPAALNSATDPISAFNNNANPVLPAGVAVPVSMWMAIPVPGGLGITGFGLDLVSTLGSTGSGTTAHLPARWAGLVVEGLAGTVWNSLLYSTAATPVGPGGVQPAGEPALAGYLLYLINTFTVNGVAGDSIYLEVTDFSSIGDTSPGGIARAAFGFNATGWDTDATNNSGAVGNSGTADGFDADGTVDGPVRSRVADLTVVPEPTTIALLGLAGLLARRRR